MKPYQDEKLQVEERVEDLLARMTLDEKLEQLAGYGESAFDTKENERLGIPSFKMTDGPIGVRWDKTTAFPCGVAVAATWDTALVDEFASALAYETRAKGRNFLLGPCVNIHRLPTGGRNFESYGEDPYLTSRLALKFIKTLQSNSIIPCIKHFALNNQEWMRTEVNVLADERSMHEIYLPSFETAVKEGNVWSVMSAYNKLNGWWCGENNDLLNEILKNSWGFKGLVVSDWGGTHSTVYAANHGLDIEMPSAYYFSVDSLKGAIENNELDVKVIDDKVRRILRVKFLSGLFDKKNRDTLQLKPETHKQLALKLAKESIVLLKNDNNLLPIDLNKISRIAVIGPNAAVARTGGGGSSRVNASYTVSPLEGIRNLVGNSVEVLYSPGDELNALPFDPINGKYLLATDKKSSGLNADYFNNKHLEGIPSLSRIDSMIDFKWEDSSPAQGISKDNFSVKWSGFINPPVTRKYTFYTASDDGVRLYVDGKLIIDNWTDHGTMVDKAEVYLENGKLYDFKVEYYENGGSAIINVGWDLQVSNKNQEMLADAISTAKKSDIAIVFAGSSENIESEGFDRKDGLLLSGQQNELITAVAEINPRTIVVLNTGTPVITKSWLSKVPALIETFFAGQEGGNAIAEVLFGRHNPSAKLPFSFIAGYDQSPAYNGYMDKNLEAPYSEGIFVGYRYIEKNNLKPTFPFGHGLSYTQYKYSNISAKKLESGNYIVTATIKNIGRIAGNEIVQLYISDKQSTVPRPIKELKGFTKVVLSPGEEKVVTFELNSRSFAYYDILSKGWKIEPGVFEVLIGSSSADIRLRTNIEIK